MSAEGVSASAGDHVTEKSKEDSVKHGKLLSEACPTRSIFSKISPVESHLYEIILDILRRGELGIQIDLENAGITKMK